MTDRPRRLIVGITGASGALYGVRLLQQVRLYEASFVNIPMNPLAGVNDVKAERLGIEEWKDLSDREREAHLKTLGLSDGLAKQFVRLSREEKGAKGRREAGDSGKTTLPDFASLIRNATQGL